MRIEDSYLNLLCNKKFKIPVLLTNPSILLDEGKMSWNKVYKCLKLNEILEQKNLVHQTKFTNHNREKRNGISDSKNTHFKIQKFRINKGRKMFEFQNKEFKFFQCGQKLIRSNSFDIFKSESGKKKKDDFNEKFHKFLNTSQKYYFDKNTTFHKKIQKMILKKSFLIYSRSFSESRYRENKLKSENPPFKKVYYHLYIKYLLKTFLKIKVNNFWKKFSENHLKILDKKIKNLFLKTKDDLLIITKKSSMKKDKINFKTFTFIKSLKKNIELKNMKLRNNLTKNTISTQKKIHLFSKNSKDNLFKLRSKTFSTKKIKIKINKIDKENHIFLKTENKNFLYEKSFKVKTFFKKTNGNTQINLENIIQAVNLKFKLNKHLIRSFQSKIKLK